MNPPTHVPLLTHLDLFSGIGGFAIAAQSAGFQTLGFSEVEPYACAVLAERFPSVPNLGDVRARASFAHLAGGVALLTGGYPCQPFSLAGQRRGTRDDRHLWPAMRDIIEDVRPSWVVGENVAGHVSMGLDAVLSDLEDLGYAGQPFVIPACAVDARHRRERVWVVAHAECLQCIQRRDVNGERRRAGKSKQARMGREPSVLADARRAGWQEWDAPWFAANQGHATGRDAAQWREWKPEPAVGRVADGIPHRSHRLKGLGNAIVPQVAQAILCVIAEIKNQARSDGA